MTNTATVVPGQTADPNTSNNTTSDPTTLAASSDLSIVKSHTGSFILGKNGTYSLAVSNLGPSTSPGPITVTDPLPPGETFASASGSGWTCTTATGAGRRPTVGCTLPGTVSVGQAAPVISLVVGVTADAYPSVTNTASVAGDPSDPATDPASSNNSSADPVTPTPVASLSLRKTLDGTLVSGKPATYTIKVANGGPSSATDVVVRDNLPAGLSAIGGTGTGWRCSVSDANARITCDDRSIGPKVTRALTIVTMVSARAGTSIVNHAIATSSTEMIRHGADLVSSAAAVVQANPALKLPSHIEASGLAFTGFNFIPISLGGLLLLAVGISLIVSSRRRRIDA